MSYLQKIRCYVICKMTISCYVFNMCYVKPIEGPRLWTPPPPPPVDPSINQRGNQDIKLESGIPGYLENVRRQLNKHFPHMENK